MNAARKFILDSNGMPTEEEYKIRELVYKHARERDFQLWLLTGLRVSIEEYNRRFILIEEARLREY